MPGPKGLHILRALRGVQTNPLKVLERAQHEWGDFVHFPVGKAGAIFLNDAAAIRHVLQEENRNYSKWTIQYNSLSSITGRGLITNDGEHWRKQRKLAQPAFSKQRIDNIASLVVTATEGMLARWEHNLQRGEAVVDVDDEMMRVAMEIVSQALFSMDLSREASGIVTAVKVCMDHMVYRGGNILALPDSVPTRENLRFKRALKELDDTVLHILKQRRALTHKPNDLLQMLLDARYEDTHEAMDDKQVRDEIITLIVAGHETVATALMWCFYLLSKHPAEERALVHEIDQRLGQRSPTAPDMHALSYVSYVVQETMRLIPPVWLVTRRAEKADTIQGFDVPEGALIIMSPYVIHRHPGLWDNPEGFDPRRWEPEAVKARPRFAYLPFAGGPHICIGDRFAQLEIALVLSMVLQRFRLDLVPGHPIEMLPLATIRPKHGIRMRLQRRAQLAQRSSNSLQNTSSAPSI